MNKYFALMTSKRCSYFNKYGGLPFLLKCNYDSKHFDKKMPLFYSEMLEYFKELRSGYPDVYNS